MRNRTDSLRGRTAIVTGASSGIGLCFCRTLAAMGCDLVMISNQQPQLDDCAREVAAEFGVNTYPFFCDLCDARCAEIIAEFVDMKHLDADILINNAGIFSFLPVTQTPQRKLDIYFDLHVRAVTNLSSTFARRFAARGGGNILNMSSMSCWWPMPGIAMYSATKAYIRVFSRALHYEMLDDKVFVTVATPGGIATDLFGLPKNLQRLALRLHAIQTPERFTRNAVKRMLQGKKQYINGFINRIAIVFGATAPTWMRLLIKHRMLDKNITRP